MKLANVLTSAPVELHGVIVECADSINGVILDMNGQVKEALASHDSKHRWGMHYVRSLMMAHRRQMCNNFKDPGVQHYGGADFRKHREHGDAIFAQLRPPVQRAYNSSQFQSQSRAHHPIHTLQSMSTFIDSSASCFTGDTLVWLPGYAIPVSVSTLNRGDIVNDHMMVLAVTKFVATSPQLVHIGDGLVTTPYHPILPHGKDCHSFPIDLVGQTTTATATATTTTMPRLITGPVRTSLYNIILQPIYASVPDVQHYVIAGIDRYKCVTLGHGITDDPIAAHPYFSDHSRICNDLKNLHGWNNEDGIVTINAILRNKTDNLICGFI